jgi:hypothetical protein
LKETTVSHNIYKIFQDIEPVLLVLAHKYRIANADDVVQNWLSNAFIIADKFDKGQLQKKVSIRKEDGTLSIEDFDAKVHTDEDFIRSLKLYLKTSFTNDLKSAYNKTNRRIDILGKYGMQGSIQGYYPTPTGDSLNSADINDLIAIVEIDIERLGSDQRSLLNLANQKLLEAVLGYCKSFREYAGNAMVVKDLREKSERTFFLQGFRDDMEKAVRKSLCKIIIEENNPMLIQKLSGWISKDKKGTLQKRLFRYFFDYYGGYPKRLVNRA